MSWADDWNGAESDLAALRIHDARLERVERIRARCVAAAAANAKHDRGSRRRLRRLVLSLEPAFALGLSALYLAATVAQSLALRR
jgi:hypothetical protein